MSIEDIMLNNVSPGIKDPHRMDSVPLCPPSHEDDHTDTNIASDDEDLDMTRRHSRSSSLNDDSGFNSSASEDRDDTINMPLRWKCDNDNIKAPLRMADNTQGHNTQKSMFNSAIDSDGQIVLTQNGGNFCSEMKRSANLFQQCAKSHEHCACCHEHCTNPHEHCVSSNEYCTNSHQQPKSLLSEFCHRNNVSDNSSATTATFMKNTHRSSRRQITFNQNSLAIPATPVSHRTPRTRRHRVHDMNNNDSRHQDLNSYLGTAPFKLQDCFQNQGIISLVACVAYTFVLMIIFCVLGLISDYLKSAIGQQNLRNLRADIVQSRRMRTNMATG